MKRKPSVLLIPVACLLIPVALFALGQDSRTTRLTLAANAGGSNCLKSLDVTLGPGAPATVRVLANGTTAYAVDLSSGGGMIRDWDETKAICTAKDQIMEVYVDAGAFKLNTVTFLR